METKPTLLRLRTTTVEMLKLELEHSSHRSMAALADDILSAELQRRMLNHEDRLEKLIRASRST
tara:strand:+ start:5111 stop:5302 length:192 start_codon:yes stop_codon:yes gene_type:complete